MVNIKCKFHPKCKKNKCNYSHPVDKEIDSTFLNYTNYKLSLNEEDYMKYNILTYENDYHDIFNNIKNLSIVDEETIDNIIDKINTTSTSFISNLEYFKSYKYTPKDDSIYKQEEMMKSEIINKNEVNSSHIKTMEEIQKENDFSISSNKEDSTNIIEKKNNNNDNKVQVSNNFVEDVNKNNSEKIRNIKDNKLSPQGKIIENNNINIESNKKDNRKRTRDLDYWEELLNKNVIKINKIKINNEIHKHCSEIINNEIDVYRNLAKIGKIGYDMKPKNLYDAVFVDYINKQNLDKKGIYNIIKDKNKSRFSNKCKRLYELSKIIDIEYIYYMKIIKDITDVSKETFNYIFDKLKNIKIEYIY